MDWREALRSGFDSLRVQRLRAFLTMLGMIFGVAAVIGMLSIGAGAEAQAMLLIDAMGVATWWSRFASPRATPNSSNCAARPWVCPSETRAPSPTRCPVWPEWRRNRWSKPTR